MFWCWMLRYRDYDRDNELVVIFSYVKVREKVEKDRFLWKEEKKEDIDFWGKGI